MKQYTENGALVLVPDSVSIELKSRAFEKSTNNTQAKQKVKYERHQNDRVFSAHTAFAIGLSMFASSRLANIQQQNIEEGEQTRMLYGTR